MSHRGRIANLWWAQGKENPRKGYRKPESERSPRQPQTYTSYYRDYYKTPDGIAARRRAQARYRARLEAKWGCNYMKAAVLEREEKQKIRATSSPSPLTVGNTQAEEEMSLSCQ